MYRTGIVPLLAKSQPNAYHAGDQNPGRDSDIAKLIHHAV